MTEDDAKEQDCIGPESCGRQIGPVPDGHRRVCIGSACGMAWRWSERMRMETVLLHDGDMKPEGDGWTFAGGVSWTPKTKDDPLGQRGTPETKWSWERPYLFPPRVLRSGRPPVVLNSPYRQLGFARV